MKSKQWVRKQITVLADELAQKRSDVNEALYDILDGREVNPKSIEHRFVKGDLVINGEKLHLMYDTLTTSIKWSTNGVDWKLINNITYND